MLALQILLDNGDGVFFGVSHNKITVIKFSHKKFGTIVSSTDVKETGREHTQLRQLGNLWGQARGGKLTQSSRLRGASHGRSPSLWIAPGWS